MFRAILDSCESVYNFKNSDEVTPFQVSGYSRNGNTIADAVEASENKTQSELNLYEFLERTEAYNHNPERVEHIQTHISHVFIASPFVYKIKKPVDFGFLDYSTPSKRKHFYEREVELNRRLCSSIYLGVVPVSKKREGFKSNRIPKQGLSTMQLRCESLMTASSYNPILKKVFFPPGTWTGSLKSFRIDKYYNIYQNIAAV